MLKGALHPAEVSTRHRNWFCDGVLCCSGRAVYASAERTHSRRQARGHGPQDNGCASLVEFKTASAGKKVTATYWDDGGGISIAHYFPPKTVVGRYA